MPISSTRAKHTPKTLHSSYHPDPKNVSENNETDEYWILNSALGYVYAITDTANRLWKAYTRSDSHRKTLPHGKKHKSLLHSLRCSICNRIPSTNTLLHCTSCGNFYVCEHCFFASNHAMDHSFVRVRACHYPLPPSNSTEKETYCFCDHPSMDPNVEILPLLPKAVPIPLERDYFGHTRTSHHNRNHESNLLYMYP